MIRLPWAIESWLRQSWPELFRNENTAQHWNTAWTRHGRDGFRATSALPNLRLRIISALPETGKVLDVGCGTGELLHLIRATRPSLLGSGADVSDVAVAAVGAAGFDAKTATLPELPFPDDHFDVVLCTETLEHVTDAKSSVRSLVRTLKPGGLLLITIPDGSVDVEAIHVHRWTRSRFLKLLPKTISDVACERHVEGDDVSLIITGRKV